MQDEFAFIATGNTPLIRPHDDPECACPPMPEAMATFTPPPLHALSRDETGEGCAVLQKVIERLGGAPGIVDLAPCDPAARRFVDEVLGEGEVLIRIVTPRDRVTIRESVFAGVWRVQHRVDGELRRDDLETGPVPEAVYEWAERLTVDGPPHRPQSFPEGLMNAPALLTEIFDHSADCPNDRPHVINLSLLPLTPEDSKFLIDTLGTAGLSVLSRGYGDCRVTLTRLPNVWWVQYFNSPGQLILNTLEITRLPAVVAAAPEDLEDSRERIAEALAQLK
ncbi:hydrogenase expression/formation protein [Methylococcus capsulatus]|jgi:hydrogenase-1 operon protein HyaF|uniref:Hydrogenase expression/formation protein HoxQ n=1 Tax=Methylococcus capsulatus TaxID=414 RepID=A0AA35XZS3_METCP|nr:hydrogenase expression/formation protein [Methylococcus capsulatus]QXP86346.1 hydrogenase expression/formation protein [Methylococcus capsulatus]CAI8781752.1 Hydrogenase expression/formation protein HoxQ [Methylococcus capsulatus]